MVAQVSRMWVEVVPMGGGDRIEGDKPNQEEEEEEKEEEEEW